MIQTILAILSVGSIGYYFICIYAARRFFSLPAAGRPIEPPPASILIPLCGKDFEAYENYVSFCLQDYPDYQIVFGVADEADSSIPVIHRLMMNFPRTDIDLVIDAGVIGENPKVNNLHNMLKRAKHELIVLVDSDIRVQPDYLASVVSDLAGEGVGLVTCLYRAGAAPNFASKIEAMGITAEFGPGVLVAWLVEGLSFAFGATIATTKKHLEVIGGLEAVANYLADDFMLGKLMSQAGYAVKLSSHVVELVLPPIPFKSMVKHQIRWARGIRACRPLGYLGSIVIHGTALATLSVVVGNGSALSLSILAATLCARMAMAYAVAIRRLGDRLLRRRLWLLPLRDLFGFSFWLLGQTGKTVEWRGRIFRLIDDGKMVVKRSSRTVV
jgi:ceramide glucosyltransferase